jgi:hypothetical protein
MGAFFLADRDGGAVLEGRRQFRLVLMLRCFGRVSCIGRDATGWKLPSVVTLPAPLGLKVRALPRRVGLASPWRYYLIEHGREALKQL